MWTDWTRPERSNILVLLAQWRLSKVDWSSTAYIQPSVPLSRGEMDGFIRSASQCVMSAPWADEMPRCQNERKSMSIPRCVTWQVSLDTCNIGCPGFRHVAISVELRQFHYTRRLLASRYEADFSPMVMKLADQVGAMYGYPNHFNRVRRRQNLDLCAACRFDSSDMKCRNKGRTVYRK